ncbi:hypothetical protein [Luteibacter sp. UNC138MFCol5.1]|uniref:hypothetical protein n=1 Tax=Luteibacter sp. UNC138MFCol5.1 TaxID=1502774 RepID=UPI000B7FE4A0|nr:hypothetical protein [Luteibacter sp. UNC138MFCol5.1]
MPTTMHTRLAGLTVFAIASLLAHAANADTPTDLSRPFDRYSWVTTHNAFSSNGLFPNQRQTIEEQLTAGVRAFMLDLHEHRGRVSLCHNRCTTPPTHFADLVNGTLLPFLERDPSAVLMLHLEDFTTRDALVAELERAPALAAMTFDPDAWDTDGWPSYEAIVQSGRRILVFTLANEQSGRIDTQAGPVHFMRSDAFTVENYWSLGTPVIEHNYACYTRWNHVPLSEPEVAGKPGWRRLFTMNHFHDASTPLTDWHVAADNAFDRLHVRYVDYCRPAAGRKPNFVAVDIHEDGDTAKFVHWLNAFAPD